MNGINQANTRILRHSQMVPERVAFIDCKMPGSHLKENYSLIGPGVSQASKKEIGITEPHGFGLGVAAMPPGITNNLHIHYTAEVFMIYHGTWLFRWGADGDEGEIIGEAGDVVSIPTWIFRGFTNVGNDNAWIFTALGGDDCGGIIWHPKVLKTAAEYGLYLTKSNQMIDTEAGEQAPAAEDLVEPLSDADIATLPHYSVEEMCQRVIKKSDRDFSSSALLDSALNGHGGKLASVIGYGITEDRNQHPKITNPHGLSIEWGYIPANGQIGQHKLSQKQVLILFKGNLEVTLNSASGETIESMQPQDVFSCPENTWRSFRPVGDEPAEFILMTPGDQRKHIEWSKDIIQKAAAEGLAIDHNGYIAPLSMLPPSIQDLFPQN
ncbi:MAG: hypothetical protein ACTH6Y_09285 [Vibrio hibernica]